MLRIVLLGGNMAEKIFISYNHKDKALIDTIARRLEIEFGRNNIFYDAWSMQPGDSIIRRMDSGLSDFTTFFLFVSPNSLASNMVKLEWQTALNRATNNNLKFVSVRIAECSMPTILTDKLYIDLYGEGIDSAIGKMRSVIKSENAYAPLEDVQNIQAYIIKISRYEVEIMVEATLFAAPNPIIAIGLTAKWELFKINQETEPAVFSGQDVIRVSDGTEYNALRFGLYRSLVPGQPFKAKICLDKAIKPFTLGVFVVQEKLDDGIHVYRNIPCRER